MKGKRPDFVVLVGTNRGRDRTHWREIGAAWWNASGESINVVLDAVPLSGKVLLAPPKERKPTEETEGSHPA